MAIQYTRPISPNDLRLLRNIRLPDEVVGVINSMIIDAFNPHKSKPGAGKATILLDDLFSFVEEVTSIPASECEKLYLETIISAYIYEGWSVFLNSDTNSISFHKRLFP